MSLVFQYTFISLCQHFLIVLLWILLLVAQFIKHIRTRDVFSINIFSCSWPANLLIQHLLSFPSSIFKSKNHLPTRKQKSLLGKLPVSKPSLTTTLDKAWTMPSNKADESRTPPSASTNQPQRNQTYVQSKGGAYQFGYGYWHCCQCQKMTSGRTYYCSQCSHVVCSECPQTTEWGKGRDGCVRVGVSECALVWKFRRGRDVFNRILHAAWSEEIWLVLARELCSPKNKPPNPKTPFPFPQNTFSLPPI